MVSVSTDNRVDPHTVIITRPSVHDRCKTNEEINRKSIRRSRVRRANGRGVANGGAKKKNTEKKIGIRIDGERTDRKRHAERSIPLFQNHQNNFHGIDLENI